MKKDKTHIELNKFSIEITKSIIIIECIKYTFDAELADAATSLSVYYVLLKGNSTYLFTEHFKLPLDLTI